jgi:hypothetical protein
VVDGSGDDAYAVRLRPHERAALEPPSAAAIAAAAAMTFGSGRLKPPAGEDSPALSETAGGDEGIDDVLAMEEERAAAAKAARAEAVEKARQTLRQVNVKEQRDAAKSASAAAKEAAAAVASVKSAAGVWPTAPTAESDASSSREWVSSAAAGRDRQSRDRRRSLLRTQSKPGLHAEDAAATINTMPAYTEEPQHSDGCSEFKATAIAGSKGEGTHEHHSAQHRRYNTRDQGLESGDYDIGRHGQPDNNSIGLQKDDRKHISSNGSCGDTGDTSDDELRRRGGGHRGVGGGNMGGEGGAGVLKSLSFVELSHQPLGQMFDRRRRGLARSGRPRRESQLESDDSDRFVDQASAVPRWVAVAASVAGGHASDSDAGSRRSANSGVGWVDLQAGRREARRADSALATASLGHFSPVPSDSRPGSGALAEVASAVMSNGERAEVQGLHVGTAALLPYASGTDRGAEALEGGNSAVSR